MDRQAWEEGEASGMTYYQFHSQLYYWYEKQPGRKVQYGEIVAQLNPHDYAELLCGLPKDKGCYRLDNLGIVRFTLCGAVIEECIHRPLGTVTFRAETRAETR